MGALVHPWAAGQTWHPADGFPAPTRLTAPARLDPATDRNDFLGLPDLRRICSVA